VRKGISNARLRLARLPSNNGAFYQFQSSVASAWDAGAAAPFRLGLTAGSERRAAGMPPEGASGAWSLTGESAISLKKSPPVDETPVGKLALLGDVSLRGAAELIGRILVAWSLRGVDVEDGVGDVRGRGDGDFGGGAFCESGGSVKGEIVPKDDHELVNDDANDIDARFDWRKLEIASRGGGGKVSPERFARMIAVSSTHCSFELRPAARSPNLRPQPPPLVLPARSDMRPLTSLPSAASSASSSATRAVLPSLCSQG